jgi:hypothetical protein
MIFFHGKNIKKYIKITTIFHKNQNIIIFYICDNLIIEY